jgi:hypothetical protein
VRFHHLHCCCCCCCCRPCAESDRGPRGLQGQGRGLLLLRGCTARHWPRLRRCRWVAATNYAAALQHCAALSASAMVWVGGWLLPAVPPIAYAAATVCLRPTFHGCLISNIHVMFV